MVRDTPPSQDASTHQIWNSYLKECRRYAPDTKRDGRTDGHFITIKTKSEVKVKVTVSRKWYATLCNTKMHPHIKFGIPTSKNIGEIHRTQSRTDGQWRFGCIRNSTKNRIRGPTPQRTRMVEISPGHCRCSSSTYKICMETALFQK